MAKTQYSLSHDADLKGGRAGFTRPDPRHPAVGRRGVHHAARRRDADDARAAVAAGRREHRHRRRREHRRAVLSRGVAPPRGRAAELLVAMTRPTAGTRPSAVPSRNAAQSLDVDRAELLGGRGRGRRDRASRRGRPVRGARPRRRPGDASSRADRRPGSWAIAAAPPAAFSHVDSRRMTRPATDAGLIAASAGSTRDGRLLFRRGSCGCSRTASLAVVLVLYLAALGLDAADDRGDPDADADRRHADLAVADDARRSDRPAAGADRRVGAHGGAGVVVRARRASGRC